MGMPLVTLVVDKKVIAFVGFLFLAQIVVMAVFAVLQVKVFIGEYQAMI
jgi:hypothetical protein